MKIGLLGISVSSRNQGVQALAASLVDLCVSSADNVSITLLTGHSRPDEAVFQSSREEVRAPVINYRLSPKSKLREHLAWIVAMALVYRCLPMAAVRRMIAARVPWIGEIERCDLIADVRGGDSFSDIYGFKRFLIGFFAAWTALLIKGTMVQLPQTYGPFNSPAARWLARFLMKRSSLVIARDRTSQRVAQELIGIGREVMLSPDVAFSLAARPPVELVLEPRDDHQEAGKAIGINVNGLMYRGGYSRNNMFGLKMDYPGFLRRLLMELLEESGGDLWLIPHTYAAKGDVESDPEASVELRNSLPDHLRERVRIVMGEHDPHAVKGIIGRCDFFIGSRMHSCIAALSQAVPCVGVAYSMKFRGVFESVGMADWVVDGREVDDDEAVRHVMNLYRLRNRVRDDLESSVDAARQRLREAFAEIVNIPAGSPA